MSYPQPPGGYPPSGGYPPYQSQGGSGSAFGFSGMPKPGEGAEYPLYPPQPGGSFPSSSGFPPEQTYSQPPSNYGSPSAPSFPQQNTSSPYPQPGASPYAPQGGSSPYPPMVGSSGPHSGGPYPPAGGSAPYTHPSGGSSYPNPGGSSPYGPQGSSPYPPPAASSPYAPPGASSPYAHPGAPSPYAPQGGPSPYPPPGGSASPYPAQGGGFPMPPSGSQGPYPPPGGSSFPPSTPYVQSTPYSNPSSGGAAYSGGALHPYQLRPTVRPAMSFDPNADAGHLRKAMRGLGTDEKAIIQVLARRTSDQRQQIILKYQQAYGKDLVKDLKSELGGQLENTILAMMTPLHVYLAKEINNSITGLGTKENVLIEILCTRDNHSIMAIKAAYHNLYHAQLEQHVMDDTSGNFKRILVSMSTGHRDEHNMDTSVAPALAQSLHKAGAGKWGTEETEFRRIMATYSYPVLRCVFEEYGKIKGSSFENAIKSELSGDFKDAMMAIYQSIMNQAAFFASRLRSAMKGAGTNDDTLVRIVVSRCEIDMGNIKDEYKKAYGKRLEEAISNETSGDYKKVLLALIQD